MKHSQRRQSHSNQTNVSAPSSANWISSSFVFFAFAHLIVSILPYTPRSHVLSTSDTVCVVLKHCLDDTAIGTSLHPSKLPRNRVPSPSAPFCTSINRLLPLGRRATRRTMLGPFESQSLDHQTIATPLSIPQLPRSRVRWSSAPCRMPIDPFYPSINVQHSDLFSPFEAQPVPYQRVSTSDGNLWSSYLIICAFLHLSISPSTLVLCVHPRYRLAC